MTTKQHYRYKLDMIICNTEPGGVVGMDGYQARKIVKKLDAKLSFFYDSPTISLERNGRLEDIDRKGTLKLVIYKAENENIPKEYEKIRVTAEEFEKGGRLLKFKKKINLESLS
jgi:hypothetical protein